MKANIEIKGDQAIWHNKWLAAGTDIEWDMIHYDVQLVGGVVLHQGKISEMTTGEGKTLVATLPAFLNALAGRGVHIVTVNDYLAKRYQRNQLVHHVFDSAPLWVPWGDQGQKTPKGATETWK